MAAILKLPTKSKGILVLTDYEKNWFVHSNKDLYNSLKSLKNEWHIALHPNGWDVDNRVIELFDFILSPNKAVNYCERLHFSAYNFAPPCFSPNLADKSWDILHIGRNHKMKNVPIFIHAAKKVLDQAPTTNILSICPTPNSKDEGFLMQGIHDMNVRQLYNDAFNTKDYYNNFLFLTLNFDYPSPISLHHLGFFYNSAKIFVDSTKFSLGSRTVAYAIACGCPVVMSKNMQHMIPEAYRQLPYVSFYEELNALDEAIIASLKAYDKDLLQQEGVKKFATHFQAQFSNQYLFDDLNSKFYQQQLQLDQLYLNNLDVRLARHHGMGNKKHSYTYSLSTLVQCLLKNANQLNEIPNTANIEEVLPSKISVENGYEKNYRLKVNYYLARGNLSKLKNRLLDSLK